MRRRASGVSAAAIVLAGAAGCGGRAIAPSDGPGDAGGGGAPDGGSFGSFGPVVDGGGRTLGVTTSPRAAIICAGQCVDVSATATGGTPPYQFQWSSGLLGSSAQRVCPTATTTYEVTVTDSARAAGEFGGPDAPATAAVTVTVAPCADGGADAMAAPGIDAGAPPGSVSDGSSPAGGRVVCSQSVTMPARTPRVWEGGATSAGTAITDSQGNIIVTGSFSGEMHAGKFDVISFGNPDLFVMWLDSQCNFVSVDNRGQTGSSVWSGPLTLSTAAGQPYSGVIVGGYYTGSIDFVGGNSTKSATMESSFLVAYGPPGNESWTTAFFSALTPSHVFALATGSQEQNESDVVMLVTGGIDTDYGGGAVGQAGTSYVVLDSTAQYRSATLSGSIVSSLGHPSSLGSNGSTMVMTGLPASTNGSTALVPSITLFTESRQVMWTQAVPVSGAGVVGVGLALDLWNNAVVATEVDGTGATWTRALSAIRNDGTLPWAQSITIGPEPKPPFGTSRLMAAMPDGGAAVGGVFTNTLDLGAAGTLVSAGGADAYVRVYDQFGKLTSAMRWGGPLDEQISSVAVDPSGNVILVGSTTTGGTENFFVVKLAP